MPYAHIREGKVLHFPPRLVADLAGRYVAPEPMELADMAEAVAPKALPVFARDLVMSARRHRYNPRWTALNEASLLLARHCIDRMLAEGVAVPEGERGTRERVTVRAAMDEGCGLNPYPPASCDAH